MTPCTFPEMNLQLIKPDNMEEAECSSLPVYQGSVLDGWPTVTSCWQLTTEEIDQILRTRRLWITVVGRSAPPLCPMAFKPEME